MQLDNQKTYSEYEVSVNQKLLIMKGVFHNMECGMKMPIIKPETDELEGNHMLANQFSSAWILELAIKSMWELSHSKVFEKPQITKYGHDIESIFDTLGKNFCDFLSSQHNIEVARFRNELQEILGTPQSKALYFSLKECLEENLEIFTDGRYKFQKEKKINVVTGIIPKSSPNDNQVLCYGQPSRFLKKIADYIEIQLEAPDYVKNLL